jgi:MFS superfamily sulfate permease-like transporter
MGLITAIIGGLFVSILMGSKLTIKGPAAGLIVIVAGAVAELGNGDIVLGWKLSLGAMVLAGLVQILFGILKWGKFVDFFPLSAIHGMMAAIGLIIIAKQVPILLNNDAQTYDGFSPIELLLAIPDFIHSLDPKASIIGMVSLSIMLGWPLIKNHFLKRIPAPLIVLLFAIPFQYFVQMIHSKSDGLVTIGNLSEHLAINVSFDGIFQTTIFLKYVFMFAVVGTLESLLTVKAIDLIDPYQRKSDTNKDIIAVGIGNTFAALFGGLPMISEVARSAANVNNGAKTRWANFFHGFFILIFILVAAPFLELIPNAALAAMLISVGIKLAHPQAFIGIYKIGRDQLLIFITTVFFTLHQDILVGIFSGIVVKLLIHKANGVQLSSFFKAKIQLEVHQNTYILKVLNAALFTNFLSIKSALEEIPADKEIILDFSQTHLIDHSVMENLTHFKNDYEATSKGKVHFEGFENHRPFSKHPLAGRVKKTHKT